MHNIFIIRNYIYQKNVGIASRLIL